MKTFTIADGEAFKVEPLAIPEPVKRTKEHDRPGYLTQDQVDKISQQKCALADDIAEWLGIPLGEVWFAGDDVYMHTDHENRLLPETIGRPENNGTLKASPGQYIAKGSDGVVSVRDDL